MALFLLDTSVCVDILRDTLPAAELPAPGDCCLSAIVTAELRTGLAKARRGRTARTQARKKR